MIKKYFDDMYDIIQKRWWARVIAHHCYFEGTNNTTDGNYIFDLDNLGIENCPKIDDELIAMIIEELNRSPYVLDVEYTKKEDGTRLLDVNFSTIFIEEYEVNA